MLENIIFYYPSRRVGGAQLLFYNCAEWLTHINGISVFYVDYDDGYIKNLNKNNNIKFVDECNLKIPADTVVVLPLSMLLQYNELFSLEDAESSRCLFWSIHPNNLTASFMLKDRFLLPYYIKKKSGRIIERLSDSGIIRYMDYQNYHSVYSSFRILEREDIIYLPIPFGNTERMVKCPNRTIRSLEGKKELSFLWISRLMPDKLSMILELFEELDRVHYNWNIILHIVGDGSCEEIIDLERKKHKYTTIMHGRVVGDMLDELIDTIDIGVAVGTSALEIAKRYKPVIVGGASKFDKFGKRMNNEQPREYVLLSQQKGYNVGSPEIYTPGQKKFHELVNEIMLSYDSISYDCWNYVKNNHSIDKVGESLLAGINTTYSISFHEMQNNLQELKMLLAPAERMIKMVRLLTGQLFSKMVVL